MSTSRKILTAIGAALSAWAAWKFWQPRGPRPATEAETSERARPKVHAP